MSVSEEWNMICPQCGDDEELYVTFTGEAKLFPNGTEDDGDHEWDSRSKCRCGCGWEGTVKDCETAYAATEIIGETGED